MRTIRPRIIRTSVVAAAAILLGAGLAATAPTAPAFANPCNYGKQVYCDGQDGPAWQWDGVDDVECVGIPGVTWNGDTPNYSGVQGKVYYFRGGAYVLVHDSTPAPAAPAPAAPAPAAPAPAAPAAPAPAAPAPAAPAAPPTEAATETETVSTEAEPSPTATPRAGAARRTVEAPREARAGGSITLNGQGFDPGTELVIEVHSDPRRIATTSADDDGAFDLDVELPADLEPGVHEIVLLADGERVASSRITIVGEESNGAAGGAIWLLVGLGGAAAAALAGYVVVRARRGRSTGTVAEPPVA